MWARQILSYEFLSKIKFCFLKKFVALRSANVTIFLTSRVQSSLLSWFIKHNPRPYKNDEKFENLKKKSYNLLEWLIYDEIEQFDNT